MASTPETTGFLRGVPHGARAAYKIPDGKTRTMRQVARALRVCKDDRMGTPKVVKDSDGVAGVSCPCLLKHSYVTEGDMLTFRFADGRWNCISLTAEEWVRVPSGTKKLYQHVALLFDL